MAPRKVPDPPAITYTRSSRELPRQTSPPNLRLKWLNEHGIPTYPNRLTKAGARSILNLSAQRDTSNTTVPDTSKSISASNVSAVELEKIFNWEFTGDIFLLVDDARFASNAALFSEVSQLVGRASGPAHHLFSLPVEWQMLEATLNHTMALNDDRFWRSMVLRLLSIHDPEHIFVNFQPEGQILSSYFPVPNIFNLHNPQYTTGGIGWTLMNLFAAPTYLKSTSVRAEMIVERSNGSLLSGFFNVPECESSSNTQVKFLKEISCFGSFGRPDYATRVLVDKDSQMNNPELCPVVFLGEGKKAIPQSDSASIDPNLLSPERNHPTSTARVRTDNAALLVKSPMVTQMAFAAHSTLVLIIASLIERWHHSFANKKPKRKDFEIPSYAWIYGIAYGSDGILIYGFTPYIKEFHSNNYPKLWGFVSTLVSTEFGDIFEGTPSFRQRARFIRILSIIQQHAKRLKDEMKSHRLPSIFHEAPN